MTKTINEILMGQIITLTQQFRSQIARGEAPWGSPLTGPEGSMSFDDMREMHERFRRHSHEGFHNHPHDRRPPMGRERVLRIIGEEEGISQKKLSEYLSIRPQSLSELLGKLEKDGFIDRAQNEKDKREILVYLTDKGRSRSAEVEQSRSQQADLLFEVLTEEEKDTLSALLGKLILQPDITE